MHRYLSVILILCLCFLPLTTFAAGCEAMPSLSTPGKEYVVGTVTVPVGCTLKLRAGVTVKFKAGASLKVQGKLEVVGTPENPVSLTSALPGVLWRRVAGEAGSSVEVSNLDVSGNSDGLSFAEPPEVFRGVHLLDNTRNSITIGTPGFSYQKSYVFQDIWFENRNLDFAMRETGLTFYGSGHLLTVDGVHFQAKQRGVGSVKTLGNTQLVTYNNITFSGCDTQVVFTYQHEYSVIPKETCLQKELPILFIPGYGTSIHLGAMSHPPSPGEVIHNLHFIGKLTPGYTDFLKALDDSHATYEVAYYDWRQPAEVILKNYIMPALAKLKRKAGSRYVNIVAHSYGGILSRTYVQGAGYLGDIHSLVQVGTPNAGAVKAYPLWQAGVLPKDWAAVGSLMRLYGKGMPEGPAKDHDVIHSYFSSVQDLQPVYPALKRGRSFLNPADMTYANARLLKLNASLPQLHKRVSVATVVSRSQSTPTWTLVQPAKDQEVWPDGETLGDITSISDGGDGTVPNQSANLEGAYTIQVSGKHQDLPGTGAKEILKYLAERFKQPNQPLPYRKMILFSIDCPVDVRVIGSNGFNTASAQSSETGDGDVEISPEMQWFFLPDEPGVSYTASITALEDTEVRYWLETDAIHTLAMRKGEIRSVELSLEATNLTSTSDEVTTGETSQVGEISQTTGGTSFTFTPRYLGSKLPSQSVVDPEIVGVGQPGSLQRYIRKNLTYTFRLDKQRMVVLEKLASLVNPVFGITLHYLVQLE